MNGKINNNETSNNSAIFIMPRSSKDWVGAEALWVTVAGWAGAAKQKFGKSWVITTDRIAMPEEVLNYPLTPQKNFSTRRSGKLKWMPPFLKTILKDIVLWRKSKNWNILSQNLWADTQVAFVWQQHDLFSGPGYKLSKQLKVPLITYVHAPIVWEGARWGVRRFFWGWLLEHFVELRSLRKSDVVACVSEKVADKLRAMGVDEKRIIVSPMAIDPILFKKSDITDHLRTELGFEHKLVIGWTGSFRSFHGLDLLIKSFAEVYVHHSNTALILIGDGPERSKIETLIKKLNIEIAVKFVGYKRFTEIPHYLDLFDIAIVSARSGRDFHYSPLKLREYMAAGKAVLAPRAGEIPSLFIDDQNILLFDPDSTNSLISGLIRLINNAALRQNLGGNARSYILERGTWKWELDKIVSALD